MRSKKYIAMLLALLMLLAPFAVSCTPQGSEENGGEEEVASIPYDRIIAKYTQALKAKKDGTELPSREGETEEEKAIFDAVLKTAENCKDAKNMGYGKKDINSDGKDELILMSKDLKVYAIFTVYEGKTLSLITQSGKTAICDGGTVYHASSLDGGLHSRVEIKTLIDGKLEGLEFGSTVNPDNAEDIKYYKIENGEKTEITQAESIDLNDSVMDQMSRPEYYTKVLGIRFVPIFSGKASGAPAADFSSYDDILAMYGKIIDILPEYSYQKWVGGEYEELYTFNDDKAYEIFHSVFYATTRARPTKTPFGDEYDENGAKAYGYAEKDLDGDGEDELILLTDSFGILSVFTQSESGVSLVYKPGQNKSCFIDSMGLLHVSRWVGGMTGRDYEYFLYELREGSLECLFGIGSEKNIQLEHTNWYKIEGGRRIPTEETEWTELYEQYELYPEIAEYKERTKNHADLEFIPKNGTVEPTTGIYNVTSLADIGVVIFSVDGGKISFTVDFLIDAETVTSIDATALLTDDKYFFNGDGISGELEICVNGLWLTVRQSQNDKIECRSYFYQRNNE